MLEVFNLTKFYGNNKVVDNVSFSVNKGEIYGILGVNGAGKTTTIKMVLDILRKDGGYVKFCGENFNPLKEKIGYLQEERSLYTKNSVIDNISYFGKLSGLSGRELRHKINYFVDRFNFGESLKKKIEDLSKGNQQKVQIITSLIHDPDIIIFDEPFSGLDPLNSEIFREVILELKNKGKYMIFCTHQMHYAEEFCTNISIFKNGKQALKGNLLDIKKGFGKSKLILGVYGNIPNINIYGVNSIKEVKDLYEIDLVSYNVAMEILNILISEGCRIHSFNVKYKSLQEIFLESLGG